VTDDPYEVLGVRADAPAAELRRAYLRLARQHHPDYFVDASPSERAAAEARMRAVNEAWAQLGDPRRRRAFDDTRPRPFVPFSAEDDEPDPRDQPDVPYRAGPPPSTGRKLTTLAPAIFLAGAAVCVALAFATGTVAPLGLALAFLVLSAAGFVVLPLLALGHAKRDEG
jgi:curved DNA-binding protein CbpA